jgi:CubicO group peptidase (beta-lactamase class C family)
MLGDIISRIASRFRPSRFFVLALAILAGCATPPQRPERVSRGDYDAVATYIGRLIRHEMARNDVVGMGIALVDDQRIVWTEGFGHADKARNLPAMPQTIYRVGSISKLFTATAAMQLAERGKLDIDRPLQDVLPGFSIHTRHATSAITPRNLMSHHAGLPRDVAKGMFTAAPASFVDLLGVVRESEAAYPPDHVFAYSNVGISLLGHAIQNASGSEFAEYMRHSVLEPLGMASATFEPGPARSDLMSSAYRKGELAAELPLRDVPAGGLNASVIDLSHFLSMIFAEGRAGERRILRPESVAEMLRPQNAAVPLDLNFHNGQGWMLSTLGASTIENGGPVAHHAGAMLYFRSQMYALPEHKLGVVVLANSNTAGQAVDRIATETLALALEAKTGIKQPVRQKVLAADPPWPTDRLQPYVGDYTTSIGHVRIRLESGRLRADALGRSFDLVTRSDGLLGIQYTLLGVLPIDLGSLGEIGLSRRTVAGRDVLVARIGRQEMLVGERIHPPAKPARWRHRIGRYEITNAGDDHTFVDRIALIEERGFLLAELTMTDQSGPPVRLPLQIVSDDEALLLGPLADGGEALRCAPARDDEQCKFSGYTLKRVPH